LRTVHDFLDVAGGHHFIPEVAIHSQVENTFKMPPPSESCGYEARSLNTIIMKSIIMTARLLLFLSYYKALALAAQWLLPSSEAPTTDLVVYSIQIIGCN
jgi:hypothetical protein